MYCWSMIGQVMPLLHGAPLKDCDKFIQTPFGQVKGAPSAGASSTPLTGKEFYLWYI